MEPTTSIEFLGTIGTKDHITRKPEIDIIINKILSYISKPRPNISIKEIQQLAGFLNYYLAIAGKIYKIVTFFLHNFSVIHTKHWCFKAVGKTLKINKMYFNIQKHCDTHPHTIAIHCDASEPIGVL